MKHLLLFVICLQSLSLNAQTFSELLQEGKDQIKIQRNLHAGEVNDYSKAIKVLTEAVRLEPNNAEAHYFLGSAYDYNGNPDATTLKEVNKANSILVSSEFEKVIQLSPKYTGEIISLDPYTKLSSVWGCLGYAYLVAGRTDSAKWAFSEGKRRGGFSDFTLFYYRQMLLSCPKNTIMFTYGDLSTMTTWYLQTMEHVRPDITIANISMMQIPWYNVFLFKNDPTLFSSMAAAADTNTYRLWNEKTASVTDKKTGKKLTWHIPSKDNSGYLYLADFALLDIIKHNQFNRSIHFELGAASESMIGLDDHVKDCLYSGQLTTEVKPPTDKQLIDALNVFPMEMIKLVNPNSDIELVNVKTIQIEFLKGVYKLYMDKKKAEAKKLYTALSKGIPESQYPYGDTLMEQYARYYDQEFLGK